MTELKELLRPLVKEQVANIITEGEDIYQYGSILQDYIESKVKNIKGWKLDVDRMNGAFMWYNKKFNFVMLATPLWDGNAKIPFEFIMDGNDYLKGKTYPFKPTFDIKKDAKTYVKVVAAMISIIEKKTPPVDKSK